MSLKYSSLSELYDHPFDAVIDVRSPAEFAEDHFPGAINMPALSNDERAEVGTIYKQDSPFRARKLGAALVLKNVARHLEGDLGTQDGGWQPLVYCWRGGQRSGVFATLLREIGWRAETIDGGYQSYRRLLQTSLYEDVFAHKIILLDGYTGTAKTAILSDLEARGQQVIDLEALAGHRGSLLGEMPGGQPSQRGFETALARQLSLLDPNRPTFIEAESNKIGRINIPPSLWKQMIAAPRIQITAPLSARVDFITAEYNAILADPETITRRLAPLRRLRGHAIVDQWQSLQEQGELEKFAEALIVDHYDPAYATSSKRRNIKTLGAISAVTLDAPGRARLADQIINLTK